MAYSHHQRYLFVIYNYLYSKWPEVSAVGSVTSQVIINILNTVISRWGLPQIITTHNGPRFILAEFSTFLSDREIKHICTAAVYHPQANGGGSSGLIKPSRMAYERTWPKVAYFRQLSSRPSCTTEQPSTPPQGSRQRC